MYLSLLLTLMYFAGGVLPTSLFAACKKGDTTCIENSVNVALPILLDGIPELGIETNDPQFVEFIDGDLSTLKYKFWNSTIHGLKNCKISKLRINEELTNAKCEALCLPLFMEGVYEMKGQLIALPVEGQGDFNFEAGNFSVDLETKLKIVQGSDGKSHFFIKKFIAKSTPLTTIKFNLQNLFNGRTELAAVVKKFARENWFEVAKFVQDPIWTACLKQLAASLNKYLETIPIDSIVLS